MVEHFLLLSTCICRALPKGFSSRRKESKFVLISCVLMFNGISCLEHENGRWFITRVLQWNGFVAGNVTRSLFPRMSKVMGEGTETEKEIMSVSGAWKRSEMTVYVDQWLQDLLVKTLHWNCSLQYI